MFKNRIDAGKRLSQSLKAYKGKGIIVLAIPRGGVEVGYEIAKSLEAEFSIVVSRKLPFPGNPESGFGAIAEDGSFFLIEGAEAWMPPNQIHRIMNEQKEEIKRRKKVLRGDKPFPKIKDKTVILVDDGIAMGSTMRASLRMCRKKEAAKIVVASPVAGPDVARILEEEADDTVILEKPESFHAVAQVYEKWYDVPDEEVVEIMKEWKEYKRG